MTPRILRPLLIGVAIALAVYFISDGKFLFLPLAFIPAFMFGAGRGSSWFSSSKRKGPGPASLKSKLPPGDIGGPPPIPSPPKQGDPRWN